MYITFLCKLDEKRYYNLSENKQLERNETLKLIVMEWVLLCGKAEDSGISWLGHHFCTVCCLCELLLDKRPSMELFMWFSLSWILITM